MSKNTTTVSVIMNCYNSDKYLREAIDSIYVQTYDNWEIIFWDNCSTDQSALIAKSYDSRLKYFLAKETTPLGKARNLALEKAKGDYICFLDCDDLFMPSKLEVQLGAIKLNNAVLSYSSWIKINENGKELERYIIKNEFTSKFESLLNKYTVNFQSLMIDKSYLNKNQLGFDEKLSFSPDYNLVLKIAYEVRLLALSEPLVKYRVHDESMSAKRKDEKIIDFDYTVNYLQNIGAENQYKNFKYIVLRAKYNLLFLDLFEAKRYHELPRLIFKYMISFAKIFLGRYSFFNIF